MDLDGDHYALNSSASAAWTTDTKQSFHIDGECIPSLPQGDDTQLSSTLTTSSESDEEWQDVQEEMQTSQEDVVKRFDHAEMESSSMLHGSTITAQGSAFEILNRTPSGIVEVHDRPVEQGPRLNPQGLDVDEAPGIIAILGEPNRASMDQGNESSIPENEYTRVSSPKAESRRQFSENNSKSTDDFVTPTEQQQTITARLPTVHEFLQHHPMVVCDDPLLKFHQTRNAVAAAAKSSPEGSRVVQTTGRMILEPKAPVHTWTVTSELYICRKDRKVRNLMYSK